MSDAGYPGWIDAFAANGMANALAFMVRQMMAGASHVAVVVVKGVTANSVSGAPPLVNVQPMVAMVDQTGTATPHGVIYNIPTMRFQAGVSAFICNPKVGDIGAVICADRDISSAIANQAPANPGSYRRFDWADALYVCSIASVAATTSIEVDDTDGVTITTPQNVTVNAASGSVTINAAAVSLGGTGGPAVARIGDSVDLITGLILTGSPKVTST